MSSSDESPSLASTNPNPAISIAPVLCVLSCVRTWGG